ncbi:autotransporter domain-containing protein, partial [Chlamydiales bacterium]|nr:autotransporter domain-containing protein [Chlamydiales bacterium]
LNGTFPGIEGIVFAGGSSADGSQIVLNNTSLVVDTTSQLMIASLTGNATSAVKLSNDLRINMVNGSYTSFSGVISGGQKLLIDGLGTQALSGINTYTDGTELQGGRLNIFRNESLGDLAANVDVTGPATLQAGGSIESLRTIHLYDALTLDTNKHTVVWNGQMEDTGSLIKIGAGTLTLNGTNTFSGGTDVEAGIFNLGSTGSVSSDVDVMGGAITGTGTVGGRLTIHAGGTVSPGNSIGTLNVLGNYIHYEGGVYKVDINGLGQSDLIDVSGTATINGGDVQVTSLDGEALVNYLYPVVSTDNGISGEYNSVSAFNLNLLLSPSMVYDANNAYVLFTRIYFDFAAKTPNQKTVANQLEQCDNPTLPEFTFLSTLNSLPANEQQVVLNEISGQQYTTLILSSEMTSNRFLKHLYNPIRSIVTTEPCSCFDSCSSLVDTWFNLSLGQAFVSGNENTEGLKINHVGLCVGAQKAYADCLTFGASLFYNQDNVNYDVAGTGRNRSLFGALYGVYRPENFYLLANIAFGGGRYNVSRSIHLENEKYMAKGSPSIYQSLAYIEGGFDLPLPYVLVQPFLGIKAVNYKQTNFNEYGDTIYNLNVSSVNKYNGYSRLGFHITGDPCCCLALSFDIDWKYYFASTTNNIHERFQSFCNLPNDFKITGLQNKQNSIELTGSVRYSVYENLEFSGEVNSE